MISSSFDEVEVRCSGPAQKTEDRVDETISVAESSREIVLVSIVCAADFAVQRDVGCLGFDSLRKLFGVNCLAFVNGLAKSFG